MKILNVAWRTLRSSLFDKRNWLMMFLMPLAFSLIFGLLINSGGEEEARRLPISVYVVDDHRLTSRVVESLENSQRLLINLVTSQAALENEVQSGRVIAGLILPAGFGQGLQAGDGPSVRLLRALDTNLFIAVEQELRSLFTRMVSASVTAEYLQHTPGSDAWLTAFSNSLEAWQEPNLRLESTALKSGAPSIHSGTHIGIGFTVMFVMMAVSMAADCVLEEREWDTWSRMVAAPIGKGQLLAGYILGYFSLGWVHLGILMLMQKLMFGTEYGGGWGLLLLAGLLILCAVAVGMLMAVSVKTFQQKQALAVIVLNVTSMLGGLFFPVELFSPTMTKIAKLTPQFWARQGFVDLVLRGSDWSVLQGPCLVLAGYSLISFAIAWQRLRVGD